MVVFRPVEIIDDFENRSVKPTSLVKMHDDMYIRFYESNFI